jgi:hypothetical protein
MAQSQGYSRVLRTNGSSVPKAHGGHNGKAAAQVRSNEAVVAVDWHGATNYAKAAIKKAA